MIRALIFPGDPVFRPAAIIFPQSLIEFGNMGFDDPPAGNRMGARRGSAGKAGEKQGVVKQNPTKTRQNAKKSTKLNKKPKK